MNKFNEISTSELASLLGVTTAFISNVKHGRKKLSSKHAMAISATYEIPLWELRPDIYPEHLFNKDVSRL